MSSGKQNASRKNEVPLENADDDFEMDFNCDKSKVECICPKCDKKHILSFHWIGRGTPRKYCQSCRDTM
jgi:hypothetical protein